MGEHLISQGTGNSGVFEKALKDKNKSPINVNVMSFLLENPRADYASIHNIRVNSRDFLCKIFIPNRIILEFRKNHLTPRLNKRSRGFLKPLLLAFLEELNHHINENGFAFTKKIKSTPYQVTSKFSHLISSEVSILICRAIFFNKTTPFHFFFLDGISTPTPNVTGAK
jgi:hypothetical protein